MRCDRLTTTPRICRRIEELLAQWWVHGPLELSEGMFVIARSISDEAIPVKTKIASLRSQ